MMKTLTAVASAALILAAGGNARADTFSPGNQSFNFSGPVTLDMRGVVLSCTLNMQIRTNVPGTSGHINTMNVTGGLCGLVTFYPIFFLDALPSGSVEIKQLYVSGLTPPPCGPNDVPMTWNGGTQTFGFNSISLDVAPCMVINGSVSNTGASITILP